MSIPKKPLSSPCLVCGKIIPQKSGSGRVKQFCDSFCRKPLTKTVSCPTCDKLHTTNKRNKGYCSLECVGKTHGPSRFSYTCHRCGKSYHKRNRRDAGRFCSHPCFIEDQIEKNRIGRSSPLVFKECLNCGNTHCRHRKRYCSDVCRKDAESKRFNELRRIRYVPRDKVVVTCLHCGKAGLRSQGAMFCSQRCSEKTAKRNRNHRIRAQGNGERIYLGTLYRKCKGVCGICGEHVDQSLKSPHPESASIDHIIPISKGGSHTWENVQLAHMICNSKKGNRDGNQ